MRVHNRHYNTNRPALPSSRQAKGKQNVSKEVKPHACLQCDKKFCLQVNLKKHTQVHTGAMHGTISSTPNIVCRPHCKQRLVSFVQPRESRTHERKHGLMTVRPHGCGACPKLRAFSSQLHIRARLDDSDTAATIKTKVTKPQKCQECGEENFASAAELRQHVRAKHANVQKRYLCSECGLKFMFPCFLRAHLRKHSPTDRPFACAACGRRFIYRSQLAIHSRTHTGAKPSCVRTAACGSRTLGRCDVTCGRTRACGPSSARRAAAALRRARTFGGTC